MRTALATMTLALLWGCTLRSSLPVYGTVPPFKLRSQDGTAFSSDELADRVWVASFIFTTCNGPCPRMTAQFRKIQDRTAGLTGVRLLSLTVDPDHDTPAVLEEYSKRFGADPKRWHFLTGDKAELEKLSDDTFHLNKIGAPGLDHSTRFVLVDRKGRIRGFYDSTDSGVIDQVAEDIRKLETEVF